LERIVNKRVLDIPTLRAAKKRGERYQTETKSGDRMVNASMIDVVVPFDGDPQAFQITPTQCNPGPQDSFKGSTL
jgi:hypothetical protein